MKTRHKLITASGALALALFGTSCTDPHYSYAPAAKRGAVVGGLVGAGAGALIGEHRGRELEGAAIGAAVGALTGGTLGSARDDRYRSGGYYQSPRSHSYDGGYGGGYQGGYQESSHAYDGGSYGGGYYGGGNSCNTGYGYGY